MQLTRGKWIKVAVTDKSFSVWPSLPASLQTHHRTGQPDTVTTPTFLDEALVDRRI